MGVNLSVTLMGD